MAADTQSCPFGECVKCSDCEASIEATHNLLDDTRAERDQLRARLAAAEKRLAFSEANERQALENVHVLERLIVAAGDAVLIEQAQARYGLSQAPEPPAADEHEGSAG
jgi:predicted RNase H-like nuclease